jgi:hypothetical protein
VLALMMKAAGTSETLINFYETTRRNNPEDSILHTSRRETSPNIFSVKDLKALKSQEDCLMDYWDV